MFKRVLMVLLILIIGVMMMLNKQPLSSSPTTTLVHATGFLELRPGSDKTHSTLTYDQLMAFKQYVFNHTDAAIDDLRDVNVTKINQLRTIIEMDLSGLTESQFISNYSRYYSSYEDLFTLYSYTLESRDIEGRGIWHRPYESNLDEVRQTLSDLQTIGINMLFVETFWMGRLIYDSSAPDTFQHGFTTQGYADEHVDYGTNLLKAFTEEAKAYGIEVHAWVENFFVGYGTSISGSPILQAKPEWASYNYDGTIPQKFETNYLFMDPANPETRAYLKALYVEMVEMADIASIHLDYIRYPVSQNQTSATNNRDTGYSAYAEREFKYLYGYTGDLRDLVVTSPKAAKDWQDYKTKVISDFVAGVYYVVKNANPDVYLSSAIFGNVENAISTKNQDWFSWSEDGYIEMILPMAYYQSATTVRLEVDRLTNIVDNNAFSYAGLASSFMGYNDHLNTAQIEASLSGQAQGVTFFATQNFLIRHFNGTTVFNEKVQGILGEGAFRQTAILPHGDLTAIIETAFDEILDRVERLYIPNEVMTNHQATALENVFVDIKAYAHETQEDLNDIIDALENINVSSYAASPATQRTQDSIDYLVQILTIRAKRLHFDDAIDISVDPDLPSDLPPLQSLSSPQNLRIDEPYIRWDAVPRSQGYNLRINGHDFHVEDTFFDLTTINLFEGVYQIEVQAMGEGVLDINSDYSESLYHSVTRLTTPDALYVINDTLYFTEDPNAIAYRIHIGTTTVSTETPYFDLRRLTLNPQTYNISVISIGDGVAHADSRASISIHYRADTTAIQHLFETLFKHHSITILNDGE